MRVGAIEIQPVVDGCMWDEADKVMRRLGVADPWASHDGLLDEQGRIQFAVGGYLVRTGERIVLVDTGLSINNGGQYAGGQFMDSLAALGVTPDAVTDVLFSHLHFDHLGWATRKGQVTFPNATYRVHRRDWDFFMEGPGADEGVVRKLKPAVPQFEVFDRDGPVLPGIDARLAAGHTPGSTVFIVSGERSRVLLLGDVVHTTFELEDRDWDVLVDLDPEGARTVRNAIADEVADTDDVVTCPHFAGLRFGRVVTTDGRRKFHFV